MKTRSVIATVLTGMLLTLSMPTPVQAKLTEVDSPFPGVIELKTADGLGTIEIISGTGKATDADARLVADTLLDLANGNPERGLLPSPTFEAIVEEATANKAGKVLVRVERDSSATAFGDSNGEPAKGPSPSKVAFDVGDFKRLAKSASTLETDDDQLREDVTTLVFLATVVHEFRHAGLGMERVEIDGKVVLQKRVGGEDQYPDPVNQPTLPNSPARAEDKVPKGSAVEAENKALAEAFGDSGLAYFRNNYGYKRATDGNEVYDFTVTVPDGDGSRTETLVLNVTAAGRLLQTVNNQSPSTVEDDGFRLDQIPQFGRKRTPTEESESVPEPADEDRPAGDGGSTDEDDKFACTPNAAPMRGRGLPQAGIEIDLAARTCQAVSGLPSADQLVIDDLGGTFGGSGSGLKVLEVAGGSFANEDTFYTLKDLVTGEPVAVTLEDEVQRRFTVEFTIDDSEAPSLKNASVTF